jgi:hypothetical protein
MSAHLQKRTPSGLVFGLIRLLTALIALAYLAATLIFKAHEIQAANPGLYPTFIDLLRPRPILLVYAIAPLLIAIAIYHLYRFTLAGCDPLTRNFTPAGLRALRLSGLFLSAGGIVFMGFETLLGRLIGVATLPFNSGTGLPFMIIGFALATISRNGNFLASRAKKLRSELDDIV